MSRTQVVRVGNNTTTMLILNTVAPQGCVLSPLLYSSFTHDCMAKHDSNTIIKFAEDNDETAYREEVRDSVVPEQQIQFRVNVEAKYRG